jgi:hypothetical protein
MFSQEERAHAAGAESTGPRCAGCAERIGVYEPAVWLTGPVPRISSRAADPELAAEAAGRAFHVACYQDRHQ